MYHQNIKIINYKENVFELETDLDKKLYTTDYDEKHQNQIW